MPPRTTHVRVSHESISSEAKSTMGTPVRTYQHVQWLRCSLTPVADKVRQSFDRQSKGAMWVAYLRSVPAVKDTDRLVAYADGVPERLFDVQKVLQRGEMQEVMLEERAEAMLPGTLSDA